MSFKILKKAKFDQFLDEIIRSLTFSTNFLEIKLRYFLGNLSYFEDFCLVCNAIIATTTTE